MLFSATLSLRLVNVRSSKHSEATAKVGREIQVTWQSYEESYVEQDKQEGKEEYGDEDNDEYDGDNHDHENDHDRDHDIDVLTDILQGFLGPPNQCSDMVP